MFDSLVDRQAMKTRKKAESQKKKHQMKEWEATKKADVHNSKSRKRDQMIRRDPTTRQQMGVQEEEFYEHVDDTDRTLSTCPALLLLLGLSFCLRHGCMCSVC